jgi:peptidoglycan-associated lipoprotein
MGVARDSQYYPTGLGKEKAMPQQYRSCLLYSGVLSLLLMSGCAPEIRTAKSTARDWTAENRLASARASEGSSRKASEALSSSSLDALRGGESTSTSPSSPLKEIYFEFDRYELRTDARETLDANAKWLKEHPSVRVEIEGHCDERGTNEYNLGLAAKRAQAARDYLMSVGIAAHRLSTVSYGEEIPVCREQTESCWQKNRRDRFVIASAAPAS